MEFIVEDTNILIDLFNAGLIKHCQRMDYSFHTTDLVIREITDPGQKATILGYIRNEVLKVVKFEGDDFVKLIETVESFEGKNNLTDTDCSVMLLAERLHCRLLTADKKLINQARQRGLQVNGFLWLTDRMVEFGIVSAEEMAKCLERYRDTNPRAKEPETSERIDRYKATSC